MEKTYKTVGEVKKRISALFKEGYLFTDMYPEKFYFIHSSRIKDIASRIPFIVIILKEYHSNEIKEYCFMETEEYYTIHVRYDINNVEKAYKLLNEKHVFDILDFHLKYKIYALWPSKRRPNFVRFKSDYKRFFGELDFCEKDNIQLSEEILGEIFFARNIIEEYARKGIYDFLCEICKLS